MKLTCFLFFNQSNERNLDEPCLSNTRVDTKREKSVLYACRVCGEKIRFANSSSGFFSKESKTFY